MKETIAFFNASAKRNSVLKNIMVINFLGCVKLDGLNATTEYSNLGNHSQKL